MTEYFKVVQVDNKYAIDAVFTNVTDFTPGIWSMEYDLKDLYKILELLPYFLGKRYSNPASFFREEHIFQSRYASYGLCYHHFLGEGVRVWVYYNKDNGSFSHWLAELNGIEVHYYAGFERTLAVVMDANHFEVGHIHDPDHIHDLEPGVFGIEVSEAWPCLVL